MLFRGNWQGGRWAAVVMFAPDALAWLECVCHLGSPQNAVGFELTSQDSIREPTGRGGWGERGFRCRQRTWGHTRLPCQEGITLPSTPFPTLASTPNSSTQGYQQPGENSHSRKLIEMYSPFSKPTSTFISTTPVRSRR